MKVVNDAIVVGTTPTAILSFYPDAIHSMIVESDCVSSIDLGDGSVISDDGLKLVDGATLSFSYRDFDRRKLAALPRAFVTLYAVGHDITDAVRVFGWRE